MIAFAFSVIADCASARPVSVDPVLNETGLAYVIGSGGFGGELLTVIDGENVTSHEVAGGALTGIAALAGGELLLTDDEGRYAVISSLDDLAAPAWLDTGIGVVGDLLGHELTSIVGYAQGFQISHFDCSAWSIATAGPADVRAIEELDDGTVVAGNTSGDLFVLDEGQWTLHDEVFGQIQPISGASLDDFYVVTGFDLIHFDGRGADDEDLGLWQSNLLTHVGHRPGMPGHLVAVGYSGMVLIRAPD